jgi:DNA-binding IclR family transcriptional regulator
MTDDRHFVTALARGLSVLACFRSRERTLGNHEIARRCKLPKSTVSRLTYTLTRLGYLVQVDASGEYALGNATLSLGSAMLARLDVRQLARPAMQTLAELSGGTVSIGVYDQLHMIYVEHVRSSAALSLSLDVGSRVPVATSAIGRAFLAALDEGERSRILAEWRETRPAGWARVRSGVRSALAEYKVSGCCSSFGDWHKDVNGIAVAVRRGDGTLPLAINCGGLASSLTPRFLLHEVRPRLIFLAGELERTVGSRR